MKNSMTHLWQSNWPQNLREAISELGFESIVDFLRAFQGLPYKELSKKMNGVVPIQLITCAYDEAKQSGCTRDVAIDGLCRNINEKCSSGWNHGVNPDWQQILALSSWISELANTGNNPEHLNRAELIAKELRSNQSIESGWIPCDNDDKYLNDIFDIHWPIQADNSHSTSSGT